MENIQPSRLCFKPSEGHNGLQRPHFWMTTFGKCNYDKWQEFQFQRGKLQRLQFHALRAAATPSTRDLATATIPATVRSLQTHRLMAVQTAEGNNVTQRRYLEFLPSRKKMLP